MFDADSLAPGPQGCIRNHGAPAVVQCNSIWSLDKEISMTQSVATRDELLCAHCDMPNAASNAYCVGCGVPLAEPQPSSLAPAPPPRQRCGVCGITNPLGAAYCVNCGVSLAGAQPVFGGPGPGGTLVQHIYVTTPAETPILARALWFLFIGLWAGQIWLLLAWLLNLTLIGLPLGMWMLNHMPQVMTLRSMAPRRLGAPLHSTTSFTVRVIYFVLIGWWVSLLWLQLAWLAAATIIGLPLAFLMFERVATVMTLAET
jgi:uncharacterized membrane protein YccF (DUF307 family)